MRRPRPGSILCSRWSYSVDRSGRERIPLYNTVRVMLVAGWRVPCVAITLMVDVTARGVILATPQPVQRPSPSATATPADSICKLRRLFRPKQQRDRASAEPGYSGLESRREAMVAGEVATVSVDEAIVPEVVIVAGEKSHDAPAGSPEQEREASEANPFCGVTITVVVPLCPAVSVSAAGVVVTEKLGEADALRPMVKLAAVGGLGE